MKMLKSKNIRRICVLLAMVAPAVYLFGSLFAGLTGAHGTQVFADEGTSSQTTDYTFGRDYRLFIENGSFGTFNNAFTTSIVYPYPSDSDIAVDVDIENPNGLQLVVSFYSGGSYVSEMPRYNSTPFVSFSLPSGIDAFRVSLFHASLITINTYMTFPLSITSATTDSVDYYSAVGNSQYVFGQFFAKDNFLEQIGKDVLSDNPHGFVPFASFWRYLDNNMLHMGDMQLGLMGYGYVYYCCHVLLFDIAFILVTFFLDFIQKVNDKVVGGVD